MSSTRLHRINQHGYQPEKVDLVNAGFPEWKSPKIPSRPRPADDHCEIEEVDYVEYNEDDYNNAEENPSIAEDTPNSSASPIHIIAMS